VYASSGRIAVSGSISKSHDVTEKRVTNAKIEFIIFFIV